MQRLPKGFGSVTKLSGNRRLPYAARISFKTAEGVRQQRYIGYYKTRAEAMQALADLHKHDVNLDQYSATVADIWAVFQDRRFTEIGESGRNVYSTAYKRLGSISNRRMRELKTYELQQLVDNINKSWQSKSHVVSLLHQFYEIAMELDICQKNYAEFIKLPPKPKSDIHKSFTKEEITVLWQHTDDIYIQMILIYIYTGLRAREFLEIKVENIHIEEQYMIAGKKTEAGIDRVVPIADKILPFVNNIFVKGNKKDVPRTYAILNKRFADTLKRVGLSDHLLHDCRHTFSSLAHDSEADLLETKLIMGHSVSDLTEGTYTHVPLENLLNLVNNLFYGL